VVSDEWGSLTIRKDNTQARAIAPSTVSDEPATSSTRTEEYRCSMFLNPARAGQIFCVISLMAHSTHRYRHDLFKSMTNGNTTSGKMLPGNLSFIFALGTEISDILRTRGATLHEGRNRLRSCAPGSHVRVCETRKEPAKQLLARIEEERRSTSPSGCARL